MKKKSYCTIVYWLIILAMSLSVSACDLFRDVLRGLDNATIFYYTPITYCNAIFDEEGAGTIDGEPITVQQVLVYRIDAIENNSDLDVPVGLAWFDIEPGGVRSGFGRIANLLTTFSSPTIVPANSRVEWAGLVAKRIYNAEAEGAVAVVSDSDSCEFGVCFHVRFPKLNYTQPGFAGIMRGSDTRTVDARPCRAREVLALELLTP